MSRAAALPEEWLEMIQEVEHALESSLAAVRLREQDLQDEARYQETANSSWTGLEPRFEELREKLTGLETLGDKADQRIKETDVVLAESEESLRTWLGRARQCDLPLANRPAKG